MAIVVIAGTCMVSWTVALPFLPVHCPVNDALKRAMIRTLTSKVLNEAQVH